MKSLLTVSHGSRIVQANNEILQLSEEIGVVSANRYQFVKHAFLEFAGPSIGDQIEQLASEGVKEIVILPLFLTKGKHVTLDIPAILETASQKFQEISFIISDHLGGFQNLKNIIMDELSGLDD